MSTKFEKFVLSQLVNIGCNDMTTAERRIANELVERKLARWFDESSDIDPESDSVLRRLVPTVSTPDNL